MNNQKLALLEIDMGWSIWLTRSHLPFHIGRHPDNNLINSSICVSRRHCKIDFVDGELHIIDSGSLNGTVLHNRVLNKQSTAINFKTCILLSDMMIWVTPCNDEGELIKSDKFLNNDTLDDRYKSDHGVCLVDICDSMDSDLEKINHISQVLRTTIIGQEPDKLLLLKHMGDGYLAVFNSTISALSAGRRLLSWQASKENVYAADIRVTLDSGITHSTHGHDRSGIPICRAARIEKTQKNDIEVQDGEIDKLKSHNRCLMTRSVSDILNEMTASPFTYIGKRKLKGFPNELHEIYQYDGN